MLALPLAMLAAAPGCIHGSKAKDAIPTPPQQYAERRAEAARAQAALGRWWRTFNDPRLNRLMDEAFRGNLGLRQAWVRLEAGRAAAKLAASGYWPRISASAAAGRSQSQMELGQIGSQTITRTTLTVSAAVAYEVDLWGRVRYGVKAAKKELEATEEDLRAAYLTVAAQLADAYFVAASLRAQLVLVERTIASRESHVELVERRYREGVVTALDLYQARGNLATAQAQQAGFRQQLAAIEHAIAVLVGRYPGDAIARAADALPEQVTELPLGVPGDLLQQRPDLRAAQHRLMAADARVGQAFAEHFPQLVLSAGGGYSFDPIGWFWSILGGLTAPLFEGRRIAANVELNRAELRGAIIGMEATLLQAVQEVEDALSAGRQLEERVQWLEEAVTAADGALRMSLDQYAQGLITFLPVLTAEQSVFTARSKLITARRELISARIQLARAVGGAWMDNLMKDSRDEQASH